jgi:hypothetical protein
MNIALTDEMTRALDGALTDHNPCLVATASGAGVPDASYRGSVLVFDSEHLAFWERAKGETLRNIQENPHICVLYRNPETRQTGASTARLRCSPAGLCASRSCTG